MELVSPAAVRRAAESLEDVLQRTPMERSRALSEIAGGDVLLKCENLQRTGSFKLRGAYHRIAEMTAGERGHGVVCASAGNHAQGVALGAALQGVDATVFMPAGAPLPKLEATAGYGATVETVVGGLEDCLEAARRHAEETGAVLVHPFDHPDVVAGQGTLGLEVAAELADTGTVVIPAGGGGLLAGMAVALRDLRPGIRIIGVQAAGAASLPASLEAGEPRTLSGPLRTIADGLAVARPGEVTLPHVRALVDEVTVVDDDTIARAVLLLLERAKLVVEPAGAAGVAALLAGRVPVEPPMVAVLTGGNIDPLVLQQIVTSGLTAEGRYTTLRTLVSDEPGELARLLTAIAEARVNVVAVEHHRLGRHLRLGQVEVVLELETRGPEHVASLHRRLRDAGYPVSGPTPTASRTPRHP